MPGIDTTQPPALTKQEVRVGTFSHTADYRRVVRFSGHELAAVTTYEGARSRDDRGQTYTLFEVRGGYRVHECNWSRWQGETDDYILSPVVDLAAVQRDYPALANAAGLPAVVDLDEDPDALGAEDDSESLSGQ